MVVYDRLSRIRLLRKHYSFKFLFIAFIGIHLPLIGVTLYLWESPAPVDGFKVVLLTLVLTLAATSVTLLVLNKLLAPLHLAQVSLEVYLKERRLPELPLHYQDEAGTLLSNIHNTIQQLDLLIMEKTGVIDLLSHDMRSPIARIIGLSQVQKIDHEAGNTNLYSDEIIKECNNALALLNDVLGILKQEEMMGRSITLVNTSIAAILKKCIDSADQAAARKKLSWNVVVDNELKTELEPILFAQAIKNVLSNAIKFSPQDGTISIESKISGRELFLSVKDMGIGFDPKDKELLFNRFTKAGRKGTNGEPSVGLGLYLCKKIIQRQGGELIAESEGDGKGATFTFIMPLKN